jgi:hypothetical protein
VRHGLALLLLLLAAAAPAKPGPPAAGSAEIAEQLAMLTFDANPLWGQPARDGLARWAGPMHLFLFGRAEDRADTQAALRALARPTSLKLQLLTEPEAARVAPNAFVVADENLALAMRGPLRGMLRNVFAGDEAMVEAFLATVVDRISCWMLPVWADPSRTLIRAAVIGVDASRPREETRACLLHGIGAALGPMGPGAFLSRSAFAPGTAAKLSRDDERMLRTLYSRALRPGMRREEVAAAAKKSLAAPVKAKEPTKLKEPAKQPAP